ncbi:hypothetical protein P5673_031667 [Acropora cervicornis]|uniref:Uncharacterized protein n=1 Tax=Acropora cervicornis TaxID=6130 RepID=A0AAD9PSG8_ACRCE|nr:hypothetical protein P5673_031667 [Acropora cervicornis]
MTNPTIRNRYHFILMIVLPQDIHSKGSKQDHLAFSNWITEMKESQTYPVHQNENPFYESTADETRCNPLYDRFPLDSTSLEKER